MKNWTIHVTEPTKNLMLLNTAFSISCQTLSFMALLATRSECSSSGLFQNNQQIGNVYDGSSIVQKREVEQQAGCNNVYGIIDKGFPEREGVGRCMAEQA
jgi:hypothetical protein